MIQRSWLRWVVALVAALVAGLSWAVASPPGSSPDDNFHMPSIWCASLVGGDQCRKVANLEPGAALFLVPPAGNVSPPSDGTPASGRQRPCFTDSPDADGNCPQATRAENARANDGLYPGLFYSYAGLFVTGDLYDNTLGIRIGVLLSVLAILALAYATAAPHLRPAMIVSWTALSMPLGISLYASINPSAWGIAGLAAMWGPLITAYRAPSARAAAAPTAVAVVGAVMAAGSRADTATYASILAVLAAAVLWRRRDQWLPAVASAMIAMLGAFVFLSSTQSAAASGDFGDSDATYSLFTSLWGTLLGFPSLLTGSLGTPWGLTNGRTAALDWLTTPMPPTTWVPLLLILGALVVSGLGWFNRRKAIAVTVVAGITFLAPAVTMVNARLIPGELLQPRYTLPLLMVLLGLLLTRPASLRLTYSTTQLWVMWAGMAIAGTAALHVWIRRYATGMDVLGFNLAGNDGWRWPGAANPNLTWLIGSVAWAVVAAVALAHLRSQGRAPVPEAAEAART